jgi:radical SAM superfamily enzyme YgiQ (UPF0313 family)
MGEEITSSTLAGNGRRKRAAGLWLCDLTYTQQTLASDVMPNAVGGIAAYAKKAFGDLVECEIIKRPEELADWLGRRRPPRLIGLSNYVWNERLSLSFARVIKSQFPDIVIVTGGPNYAHSLEGRERYFQANPYVDFHVVNEGERAFSLLLDQLLRVDFRKALLTEPIPSVDYTDAGGRFVWSETPVPRIRDLTEIPSPYVTGLLERYFDGKWAPIIQTNRGCPFTCTFCVEGNDYYNKVNRNAYEKVKAELECIAERMAACRERGGRNDLQIADSNFGIYKEDLETCRLIGQLQARYGWPEYINVATGKNNQERVLECARLINGALKLSGSVQSLDPHVLRNIKRDNISEQQLIQLALEAREAGANVYSEIILGLPGDTPEAHYQTIEKIMDADFNIVCLYQLMLLPGTELVTEESRKRWGFRTAYRVMPRCYGSYELLGQRLHLAEDEEIVIANDAITFEQYLDARRLHLIINTFYNDGVYKEVFPLMEYLGIRKYDWLRRIQRCGHPRLLAFINEFIEETTSELWEDRARLREFTSDQRHIQEYLSGERGSNLVFKYKSIGITQHPEVLYEVACQTLREMIEEQRPDQSALYGKVAEEILRFATCKMLRIFDLEAPVLQDVFAYDVERLVAEAGFANPGAYAFPEPRAIRFVKTEEQDDLIRRYMRVYGSDVVGLSRIVAKVYVGRLLRKTVTETTSREHELALRFGQTKLSGLNPFV